MKSWPTIILTAIIAFSAGYFLNCTITKTAIPPVMPERDLHLGMAQYINPLLDCQTVEVTPPKESAIKDKVTAYIENAKATGNVESVSVYYRDLFNGPSFGIETDVHFTPASLLKVPILIGYLKIQEGRPSLLSEKMIFDPKKHLLESASQVIGPPPPLTPGQSYTIKELLIRMVENSDNTAAKMLTQYLPQLKIGRTLSDMGVQVFSKHDGAWIDVRSYAGVLRILYNSTYLSRTNSNWALDLLSRSAYRDGLVRGVDPKIPVAHKFGERTFDSTSQLHDCGIVYYPNRPYLICIMTRGKSFAVLTPVVSDISKLIFDQVRGGTQK